MTTHRDGDDIDDFSDVEEVWMRDGEKGGKPLAHRNLLQGKGQCRVDLTTDHHCGGGEDMREIR